MTAEPDHLVVAAATLGEGADLVEAALGVRPAGGGRHEGAGTHNLLLGLGPGFYLEVLSPDPASPEPAVPRLFGLDRPEVRARLAAGPFLLTWVARTPALDALVVRLGPASLGAARAMGRGDLSWRLAAPPDPSGLGGLVPSLIEWRGPGAAGRLADSGCRLEGMDAEHPDPVAVGAALAVRGVEGRVAVRAGAGARLNARLRRSDGAVVGLHGW